MLFSFDYPVPLRFSSNASRTYAELLRSGTVGTHGSQDYTGVTSRQSGDTFLREVFGKYLSERDLVLEIGCNRGNNLIPLARKYHLLGLELQSPLLETLNRRANEQGLGANIETAIWDFAENGTLPPEWDRFKGKLKAIYAVQLVNHLSGPKMEEAFIALCEQYLAPGGIVVLSNTEPLDISKPGRNTNLGSASHTAREIKASFPGFALRERTHYGDEDRHFATFIPPQKLASVLERTYWWVLQKPEKPVQFGNYRPYIPGLQRPVMPSRV